MYRRSREIIVMLSLPEIASQLVDKTLSQVDEDNARTLFVVGSKGAGKSTLLNSFLDKTDAPRETLVLEYSFGRKSNQKQGIEKTICHIWEYGGKLDALNNVLPSIPVCGNIYYIVMVDLSKIKRIWDTIETCIQTMNEVYHKSGKHPEILIIGGKYDIFKSYDSEIKKFISTSIRSLGLVHNANVLFYSSKEAPLARRARDVLQNAGFGSGIFFKEKNTNIAKPLAIPKGSDSWESIGTSPMTLDQLKTKHLSRIPPAPLITDESLNMSEQQSAYPEPSLDKLANFKYEELRNLDSMDLSIDDYLFGTKK